FGRAGSGLGGEGRQATESARLSATARCGQAARSWPDGVANICEARPAGAAAVSARPRVGVSGGPATQADARDEQRATRQDQRDGQQAGEREAGTTRRGLRLTGCIHRARLPSSAGSLTRRAKLSLVAARRVLARLDRRRPAGVAILRLPGAAATGQARDR